MQLTPLEPWIHGKISARESTLTRRELEAWQLQKLNETLAWARERSRYYREALAGFPGGLASLEELPRLPMTQPEDLRRHPLQYVCVSQSEIQRVVTLQTSGTTGEPKRIYFTADDQELTIEFFGVGMSTLTRPGERVMIFLPGATPGSVGDLLRQGLERLGRKPLPYGPILEPLDALAVMEDRQADCLVGSPTQVLGLALRWKAGRKAPRTVLLSTDYVPASIVQTLEQTWGCKVFNHYGTTEMGLGGGVECEAHRGCHMREADLLYEVVDPETGFPVAEGEYGEVVFTTLTRRGMPLIRYRMGDRSRFIPGACPCGTVLRTLENISGRLDNQVVIGNVPILMRDLDEALFGLPGLLNFTACLGADNVLSIRVDLLSEPCPPEMIRKALEKMDVLNELKVAIQTRVNPAEAGRLHKRIIRDERGEHA